MRCFFAPARPIGLGTPNACGGETKKKLSKRMLCVLSDSVVHGRRPAMSHKSSPGGRLPKHYTCRRRRDETPYFLNRSGSSKPPKFLGDRCRDAHKNIYGYIIGSESDFHGPEGNRTGKQQQCALVFIQNFLLVFTQYTRPVLRGSRCPEFRD